MIATVLLGRLGALVRALPVWTWALLAVIAWGAVQKHRAAVSTRELHAHEQAAAADREKDLQQSLAETNRRLVAQGKVVIDAKQQTDMARAGADRVRSDAQRLRGHLASQAASAAAADSTAAGQCTATQRALDLQSELLGRAVERAQELAAYADEARIAGAACEQSYEALKAQ